MSIARIQNMLEKIEMLRQKSGNADWFGAKKHRFILNPPLSPNELAAFEKHHSVSLPEDYRQFMLSAGNGGVGPYYGLEPLSNWNHWFEDEGESAGYVAAPCPIVYEQMTSPTWRDYVPTDHGEWGRGSIHICEQGCTFAARLVVSGPSRGRVFNLDMQMAMNVTGSKICGQILELQRAWCPVHFAKDANFLDWYERWLDLALIGEPAGWFGYDNPDYPDKNPQRY